MLRWWACYTSAATTCFTAVEAAMAVGVPHQRLYDGLSCNGGRTAAATCCTTVEAGMLGVPHQRLHD